MRTNTSVCNPVKKNPTILQDSFIKYNLSLHVNENTGINRGGKVQAVHLKILSDCVQYDEMLLAQYTLLSEV